MKLKTNIILSLFLAACVSFIFVKKSRKEINEKHYPPQLLNLDSTNFDFNKIKGKVCIVSYFQTWCGDCVKEEPQLEKLKAEIGADSLIVLLISDEPISKIKAFKSKFNSTLDFYHTSVALKRDFGVGAYPTTYLLDKNGKVKIKKVEGINWYTPEIISTVKSLIRD